jgi:ParB family chromosome partitioning protein
MAIDIAEERKARRGKKDDTTAFGFQTLDVTLIDHGRNPRIDMASTDMKGLTDSVAKDGVLSPIRVKPDGERYTIIYGHRRFEAAKAANLEAIPAMVVAPADPDVFVQSLVENIQRADLNPLEEAQAYKAILEETKMTQSELAKRVGKSQPHISNLVRILKMPDEIQEKVATGDLTAAHAKNLAALPSAQAKELAARVVNENLTTAQLERELSYARQSEEREAEAAAQREEEANTAEGLFRDNGFTKKDTFIVDAGAKTHEILRSRGWKKIVPFTFNAHTPDPSYDCDCTTATTAGGLGMRYVQVWQQRIAPVCVDKDHARAAQAAIEAERERVLSERNKTFEKAWRKVMRGIRADDGKGVLNVEGQRVALYVLLRGGDTYYGTTSDFDRLNERHGGQPVQANDFSAGWETITGLSEADLGEELTRTILDIAFKNPLTESSSYRVRTDVGIRQWFVDQFKVDPKMAWGDHEPPSPEEAKLENQEAAAAALEAGQGDPVAYLRDFVEPHAFVGLNDNGDVVDSDNRPLYDDTADPISDDDWLCAEDGLSLAAHTEAYEAKPEPLGLVDGQGNDVLDDTLPVEAVQPDGQGMPEPDAIEAPTEVEVREPETVDVEPDPVPAEVTEAEPESAA